MRPRTIVSDAVALRVILLALLGALLLSLGVTSRASAAGPPHRASAAGPPRPSAAGSTLLAERPPMFAATDSTGPASVVVQTSQTARTTLSLQSVTGAVQTVRWTASAPAGVTVTPGSGSFTIPAGGSAGTPVTVTGGASDGDYEVTFHFSGGSGPIRPIPTP